MSNNIIDSIQLSGVTYTISGQSSGGGKAIEAGRGISVTTGETADTVSFNLPISAGTGENSIVGNIAQNTASGKNALALGGYYNSQFSYGLSVASGLGSVSFGGNASGEQSFAAASIGSTASGQRSATIAGYQNNSKGVESLTSGRYVNAENLWECSFGCANVSHKANNTWGNSGNTLFSVGNGTSSSARHNAFEIRQNGDIYLSSGGTDIKLQDHLGGGGGGGISSAECQTMIDENISGKTDNTTFTAYTASTDTAIQGKQDTLVSGTNIKTINNESILGSGNITIQGGGGNPTVELTQAEYDALVTAGTVSADTYYIITDAQGGDLSNYYTKNETNTLLGGKADTATTYTKTEVDNAITAATSTKQDTLVSGTNIKTINNQSLLGSGNIDIQGGGGGGKAIEAGRGISVTTGETADTISVSLPIWTNTANNSVKECDSRNNANFYYSHAEGVQTEARYGAHSEGSGTKALGYYSHSEGVGTIANNMAEHASGQYNVSTTGSTDADNTLFSVGNGTSDSARHNAFEIRQNGDIYLTKDGQDVKLQDQLGGGGASYSAGTGIDITNNVISVSGVVETSAITTTITSSSTDAQVPSAKAVYDIVGNIETLLSQI